MPALRTLFESSRRIWNRNRAKFDRRITFCEASHTGLLIESQFDIQSLCDNAASGEISIRTPLRIPDSLYDISQISNLPNYKEAVHFTQRTANPSVWPYECALHQVNSNCPVEDRGVLSLLNLETDVDDSSIKGASQWLLAAVIDGHSGWQTADFVSKNLPISLERHIKKHGKGNLSAEELKHLITRSYLSIDSDIRRRIEPAFDIGHSSVAKAGATTCCSLITPSKIIVANIGDTRAYLCRDGKAIPLSHQHNAGDRREAEKLRDAHPNEDDIIKCKEVSHTARKIYDPNPNPVLRLLSMLNIANFQIPRKIEPACYTKGRLQLTRSFGDFYLKDSKFALDWDRGKVIVGQPHSFPYLSVIPDIAIIDRSEARDEFLLIASDGVWDELKPEEAVDIGRRELNNGGNAASAAKRIQSSVTAQAAFKTNKTVEEMQKLAPKERRSHYDDMTIAVINFKQK